MIRRRTALLAVLLVAVLGCVGWYGIKTVEVRYSRMLADTARARLHKGMPMQEAEVLLDDAWHHLHCPYQDVGSGPWSHYLFLYGSHDLHRTGIVVVRASGPPGEQVITSVASEENYNLHLYDECSDLDLSVTRNCLNRLC
ncbi:MAG: hypothetical protein CL878_03530 [Dehalococcoidia bacterium]|nr:hypothetical protein [Dehalococcoidia bacterium]